MLRAGGSAASGERMQVEALQEGDINELIKAREDELRSMHAYRNSQLEQASACRLVKTNIALCYQSCELRRAGLMHNDTGAVGGVW